jgi:hypothetical protein
MRSWWDNLHKCPLSRRYWSRVSLSDYSQLMSWLVLTIVIIVRLCHCWHCSCKTNKWRMLSFPPTLWVYPYWRGQATYNRRTSSPSTYVKPIWMLIALNVLLGSQRWMQKLRKYDLPCHLHPNIMRVLHHFCDSVSQEGLSVSCVCMLSLVVTIPCFLWWRNMIAICKVTADSFVRGVYWMSNSCWPYCCNFSRQ